MKIKPNYTRFDSSFTQKLLRGGSFAIIAAAALSSAAMAQVSDAAEEDEVIATGIRQSLDRAQDIKRNADTFVDSITASDIGALPDRSVLEALQRVPGISISRFAGGDDPDHFSVEGSGLVIRGLDFVRSEFNGRDAFSANNGRSLGFQDVPPELVGGVDVFKNQTADMIEGGISGVVNLKTLLPFDRADRTIALTVEGTYTDFADKISPSGSALFSDRWETKIGEFGLLGNLSYGNLQSRSSGFRVAPPYPYTSDFTGVGTEDTQNNLAAPAGASIQDQQFDRDRYGVALAGQWSSNDGRHLATAQFIRSDATNTWTERTLQSEEDAADRINIRARGPFTTTPFSSAGILPSVLDDDAGRRVPVNSLFESGVLTNDAVGWTGRLGNRITGFTRVSDTETSTSDYSFNYKFTPTDRLKLNVDAQYVESTTENSDVSVFSSNFFDIGLNTNSNSVEFLRTPGDQFENSSFTDPESQYWRAAMDHFEDSEGDELALRADADYEFDSDGWFKSVRVGARFAEREQTTRWTEYNWANLSEAWNGGYRSFAGGPQENFETFDFAGFRGGNLLGNTEFLFPSVSLVSNYAGLVDFATGDYLDNAQWAGVEGRNNSTDGLITGAPQNGRFYDSEISTVNEETIAAYARVDFSNEDFVGSNGITFDGNYGLRVVNTKINSVGSFDFQAIDGEQANLVAATDPALFNLFAQGPTPTTVNNNDTYLLPSFNLKIGLNDEMILRFAAARAMSRPDVGSLRAYRQLQAQITGFGGDNGGPPTSFTSSPTIQGGNPNLRPVQATNLDASFEYYFADAGSFTASAFYKDLEDIIVNGSQAVAVEGSPLAFNFVGPINNGSGKVKGFELAYQQFYDMLPGAFSGLGIQANYTYVDQSAIPNGGISSNSAVQRDADRFVVSDLENLSKHTANIVGLYEKGPIEARVAYNWRSDFLLTTVDVITRLPVYNESTGQVDASFKYRFNDQFQIGVQGVNLLSEITETSIQIDDAGQRLTRSLFENDRRISLIGSFTF